jgi:hypothetical protein
MSKEPNINMTEVTMITPELVKQSKGNIIRTFKTPDAINFNVLEHGSNKQRGKALLQSVAGNRVKSIRESKGMDGRDRLRAKLQKKHEDKIIATSLKAIIDARIKANN